MLGYIRLKQWYKIEVLNSKFDQNVRDESLGPGFSSVYHNETANFEWKTTKTQWDLLSCGNVDEMMLECFWLCDWNHNKDY